MIPVIFLSTFNESYSKRRAFESGGVDYISKPFHIEEVLVKVKTQLELKAAKEEIVRLGEKLEVQVKESNQQQYLVDNKLNGVLLDRLTGLPNQLWFMDCVDKALKQINIDSTYQFAVLLFDCDRFKIINNSLGYRVGDELLKAMAQRLQTSLTKPDICLARFGEDQFAIFLPNIEERDSAVELANRILEMLAYSFRLQGYEIFVSGSMGIVFASEHYHNAEHLMRDAGTAMCRAKELGKSRYQIFDFTLHEKACHFLQIETDLRQAIKKEKFRLHYQPIISLKTGVIVGLEALVRWHCDR